MSIDNDNLEIITPITSKQNVNTGAQGDCLYLPVISMISHGTSYDFNDDKESSEYITDNCFRSNLVINESKESQVCFSTSSATFIVSSTTPSNKTRQQDAYNIHNVIYSDTDMELLTPTRICHDHQHQLWFRQHWISITVITGIIVTFIIIIIITIIIH
jgi:hypothetical protein